jgi:hypothetical protein
MTSFRRLALLVAIVTLALGGGTTAWLIGAGADTVPAVKQAPPGTQPNGVNFTIHTVIDPNFCVEDTPSVAVPASEATMSECAARDNQHWTFAHADYGSVVIIGGNGDCLDFTGKPVSYVSVTPCDFRANERFYYSPDGLIESTSAKKCLGAAQAAQNATIAIVKCDATKSNQIWQLGH